MIRNVQNEKSNVIAVTFKLLQQLKIRFNKSTVIARLTSHPSYPSILAISDCLATLNIRIEIYRANLENFVLSDLSFPFITHFSSNGGSFYLVNSTGDGNLTVYNEKNELVVSESGFLESWEGIILYANLTEHSGEKDYLQNRIKDFLHRITLPLFLILIFGLFAVLFSANGFQWRIFLLCLLKLSGFAVSILLLMQTFNVKNPLVSRLCRTIGKNDCNDLLQSSAARITLGLSWTEVGLFYFTGSFLTILILPILAPALAWMNIIALPFTVYSISFQYRTKKWCLLCCLVQLILLLECLAFNRNNGALQLAPILHFHYFFPLLLCFFLPIATWALLKPVLLNASLLEPLKLQLQRFKNDSDLFKAILRRQEYHIIDDELMPVSLGNPKAKTSITVVSNPFCGPCGQVHLIFEEWLRERDDLELRILFANDNKEEELPTKVALHLLALNQLEDTATVARATNDWYSHMNKDYESWAKRYPVIITNSVKAACAKQKDWCNKAEIIFTPTILINGYKLPEMYQLEDIKYLLD